MLQKMATKVFMGASVVFGVVGILIVLFSFGSDRHSATITDYLGRALFLCVFIILPSFALSVAGKYLSNKH